MIATAAGSAELALTRAAARFVFAALIHDRVMSDGVVRSDLDRRIAAQ